MTRESRIRIRWRDLDPLGHVNNAVYLTYLDEALNAWLGPLIGVEWVTLRVEIDFRRELRLEHREVAARCTLERVGTSSVTARVELARPDGETAADARYVLAAWDAADRRTRPLTGPERAALGG